MKPLLCALLLLGVSISVSGQTLREAIQAKDTILAAKLIKAGANPNTPNADGATLLLESCHFPNIPIAIFLLRHGAKVNEPRSPKGRTALMVACAYWCGMDMVKVLVEAHADVNATAQDGTTALMLAAQNEKQDVVDYLLKHGAKANLKNKKGQSALDLALAGNVESYMVTSIKDTRFNKEAVVERLQQAMKK